MNRSSRICKNDPHITVVDYQDGMENMLTRVLELTNAAMPEGFEKVVKERLQFDGKNPGMFFSPKEPDTTMDSGNRSMELYLQFQSLRSAMLTDDKTSQQC